MFAVVNLLFAEDSVCREAKGKLEVWPARSRRRRVAVWRMDGAAEREGG